MLKIVFISNYFNHHQKPLSEALYNNPEVEFYFVETAQMPQSRKDLGYGMDSVPEYVLSAFTAESRKIIQKLVDDADIVIAGSAPEGMLKNRIRDSKVIFRYSERPLKEGLSLLKYFPRIIKWNLKNLPRKPIYMLCASAYTAGDYAKHLTLINRCYKWGYFPEAKRYENIDSLLAQKDPTSILWAGRFLDWKHPDDVIEVAQKLKADGCVFTLKLIGIGELEGKLRELVDEYDLKNEVIFMGSMKPEQVREHMEKAGIYLFTSDRREGWGAVLNESMNSGCAVVGCSAIGSVPYLLCDNVSGLVYESGNIDELYEKVKYLLENPDKQRVLGFNAYKTMTEQWCAEIAAERFVALAECVLSGEKRPSLFEDGPCSKG